MNKRLKEEENELIHTYHVKQFLRPRTSAWHLLFKGFKSHLVPGRFSIIPCIVAKEFNGFISFHPKIM